jgi:hypothetical protein
MFSKQELYALLTFLKRTQISGEEAQIVVMLQQKITNALKENQEEQKEKK